MAALIILVNADPRALRHTEALLSEQGYTFTHDAPVHDAARYGAVFVAAPLDNPEFLPRVHAAVAERRRQQQHTRRWFRKPVADEVEVDAAHAS